MKSMRRNGYSRYRLRGLEVGLFLHFRERHTGQAHNSQSPIQGISARLELLICPELRHL